MTCSYGFENAKALCSKLFYAVTYALLGRPTYSIRLFCCRLLHDSVVVRRPPPKLYDGRHTMCTAAVV